MKNAIVVHGSPTFEEYHDHNEPSPSNAHWLPWLQKRLLTKGILVQTPEFPTPYEPVYDEWKAVFEQFSVTADTILVGHSCGGGFLLRYLSENNIAVGNVVLVAPWLDPNHWIKDSFFDFTIDRNLSLRIKKLCIFQSDNDEDEIDISIRRIVQDIPDVRIRTFHHYGHFCLDSMGTEAFPELLEEVM